MDENILYQQIADSVRNNILSGQYKSGDRLPSVRELSTAWDCTPGTIQRAYKTLADEGLLISRAGQGTRVAGAIPQVKAQNRETLRRVSLVNRMEAVLLEALTAGYALHDIQQAMDLAMDRWRASSSQPSPSMVDVIRFNGSHDLAIDEIARAYFGSGLQGSRLQVNFTGSLGGLIALAEGKADLAGCHLWDAESDSYNLPFIRRLMPGQEIQVVTLAHRRQGLIVAPGNPLGIYTLADLARPGVRFVNRQPGSGTRVWLDAMLARLSIHPSAIQGYADERLTHSDVARAVAEGKADVGLGLEIASRSFELDFVFLNRERYDLVMRSETAKIFPMQRWIEWLSSDEGKQLISALPGYESQDTGAVVL